MQVSCFLEDESVVMKSFYCSALAMRIATLAELGRQLTSDNTKKDQKETDFHLKAKSLFWVLIVFSFPSFNVSFLIVELK